MNGDFGAHLGSSQPKTIVVQGDGVLLDTGVATGRSVESAQKALRENDRKRRDAEAQIARIKKLSRPEFLRVVPTFRILNETSFTLNTPSREWKTGTCLPHLNWASAK